MQLKDVQDTLIALAPDNLRAEWSRFILDRLTPVVEAVSANPAEGGTIVVLTKEFKEFTHRNGHRLQVLPECPLRITFEPEEKWAYVARETLRQFVVQDGATVVDLDGGTIQHRMQLLAPANKDRILRDFLKKNGGDFSVDAKLSSWGTRHVSSLQFAASLFEEKSPPVCCIVISQDGEVHFLNTKAQEQDLLVRPVSVF